MHRAAIFDPTGTYRYQLSRQWATAPTLGLVMLNPSRADAQRDDPTLRRCQNLAAGWGFGGLVVVNLFAYCTAHPRELRQAPDPIGPECDRYLRTLTTQVDGILLAWGNQGHWQGRDRAAMALLAPTVPLYCLGYTRHHQPRHPLYVPRHPPLQPLPLASMALQPQPGPLLPESMPE